MNIDVLFIIYIYIFFLILSILSAIIYQLYNRILQSFIYFYEIWKISTTKYGMYVFKIFDLITQQQYRVYYRYNIRISFILTRQ